jgi:hypothetical protein
MTVTKYLRKFIRLNEKTSREILALLKLSGESDVRCWFIYLITNAPVAEPEVSAPVMPNPTTGYAAETVPSTSNR